MQTRRSPLLLALLLIAPVMALGGCAMFGDKAVQDDIRQAAAQPESAPAQLEKIWGIDVDQRRPLTAYSYARPVLAGDLLVLAGQDDYVHIYNMQGSELRRIAMASTSDSDALAMSAELVVLGDAQGMLYGINPLAGSIVWQWQMPSVMLGHPVRAGDDILLQTGDNSIFRISAEGKKLWSYSGAQAGLSMNITPSPLLAGDIAYAVLTNGDVVALRADTGDLLWRRQLLLDSDAVVLSDLKTPLADPVLAGNVLLASFYQGDVFAMSASDGQQIWQRSLSLKSAPLVVNGRLFVATADNAVLELDPANGASIWKRTLESSGELVGPVLSEGRLLVADDHGNVFGLGLDGKVSGTLNLPGRMDRSPVVVPGGVLLRNNLGGLYLIH